MCITREKVKQFDPRETEGGIWLGSRTDLRVTFHFCCLVTTTTTARPDNATSTCSMLSVNISDEDLTDFYYFRNILDIQTALERRRRRNRKNLKKLQSSHLQ